MQPWGRAALAALAVTLGLAPAMVAVAAGGDADDTFGTGGMISITDGDPFGWAAGLALLPDGGGIIVEGDELDDDTFARFTPNGAPVASFLGDGADVVGIPGSDAIVLANGKILVVGVDGALKVSRLLSDGSLDPTFGVAGTADVPVAAEGMSETPLSIEVDSQGRIVVGGTVFGAMFVARLLSNGTVDSSFGTAGVVEYDAGNFLNQMGGLDLYGDQPVFVGMRDEDLVAVRLTTSGSLDGSFGTGGIVSVALPGDDFWVGASDVVVGESGEVYAVGGTESIASASILAFAVDADGEFISSWADGGILEAALDEPVYLRRAAADHAGGIVATGYVTPTTGDEFWELAVVRIDGDGDLDPAFGIYPMAAQDPDGVLAVGSDVEVDADGDILVAGALGEGMVVWRFDGPEEPSSTPTTAPVVDPDADSFRDDDGSVFEADIEWLAASGITAGCNPPTNDLFCPDAAVTRGQMAAFLVRALGLKASGSFEFSDDDDSVFEADIEKLAEAGITVGCNPPTNDLFCPDGVVTRGQMAAFLHRALPDLPARGSAPGFDDVAGSVFEADITWLARTGVTRGCSETSFCPESPVTRGQMAAFLHRALTAG
jgi:uncharacterized delta-60 repeat protein